MEYVHGHSLQRLVEDRGAFAVSRAVSCIRQRMTTSEWFARVMNRATTEDNGVISAFVR